MNGLKLSKLKVDMVRARAAAAGEPLPISYIVKELGYSGPSGYHALFAKVHNHPETVGRLARALGVEVADIIDVPCGN